MRPLRNPFKLLASEYIDSDDAFVRLYSPAVLDVLDADALSSKLRILRSAPGAGKTSLMRMFTPSSLLTIFAHQNAEYARDLLSKLKNLGALDESGPRLLAIYLLFDPGYASIEDLDLPKHHKQQMFCALLTARILLSALRNALKLANLNYPDDLEQLTFNSTVLREPPFKLSNPLTGKALYEYAREVERSICACLNSFEPAVPLLSVESVTAPLMVLADGISLSGTPLFESVVVMLDDCHKLVKWQRDLLLTELQQNRPPVPVWLAERLEVLKPQELLASAIQADRDYVVHQLEELWKNKRRQFQNVVIDIADRRVREATTTDLDSFDIYISSKPSDFHTDKKWAGIADEVSQRVEKKTADKARYAEWLNVMRETARNPREKAMHWRAMEIVLAREAQDRQLKLDLALGTEGLDKLDESSVKAAAELFLCREFGMPYYFGIERLASISSTNIEQFVWLAGELFEEISSAALLRKDPSISPASQQRIILKTIERRIEALPQELRFGKQASVFLKALGSFAHHQTYQPSASYAPGVTGVAITLPERDRLFTPSDAADGASMRMLADVLTTCVAHNWLEPQNGRSKGQDVLVFYMNRMLCAHFELPLQYGGFRTRPVAELVEWLVHGFQPPKNSIETLR